MFSAVAEDTTLTPVEAVVFDYPSHYPSGHTDLSGLTWIGVLPDGRQFYYAVSDRNENSIVPLAIELDSSSGAVLSVEVDDPLILTDDDGDPFSSHLDTEGIAFDITTDTIFVSNEKSAGFSGVGIRQFDMSSLSVLNEIIAGSSGTEFDVFTAIQPTFGLESCGLRGNGKAIWTTSQQPLIGDPERTLRLQKLDRRLNPIGQYPYELTPDPGTADNFSAVDENNVHDLMILADGTVISLELVVGLDLSDNNYNRLSVYELDFAEATDVAGGTLNGAVPVTKRLLHQEFYNAQADPNVKEEYEGIALGPELDDGQFSVLLIGDSGGLSRHALYAFTLSKGKRRASGGN